MENIRTYLRSQQLFGVSLYEIVIWIFILAVLLLLARLFYRGLKWWTNRRESDHPTEPPKPQMKTESKMRPSGFDKPAQEQHADRILQQERDDSGQPAPIGSQEKSEHQPADYAAILKDKPQPAAAEPEKFEVHSSEYSRGFHGKPRSWTSRSLFGNEIEGEQADLPRVEPADVPFADQSDYFTGAPALASMMPESEDRKKRIKQDLIHAGYYTPHAYENFSAVRYLGLMLPIILFGVLLILVPPAAEGFIILLLVSGAVLGWSMPRMYLRSRAASRRREIEQALPDVIDLLNMCVSQGMTLKSALARVSWEIFDTYPVMAEELRIVGEQAELCTTEHALMNLNERVDVPELHSLTSLLIQTERMGTNVSDSLTDYSDSMRSSLQQRADQKANAATFKLLFPTVLCLMPAVFFFLLGPAVIELSEFFEQGGVSQFQTPNVDQLTE